MENRHKKEKVQSKKSWLSEKKIKKISKLLPKLKKTMSENTNYKNKELKGDTITNLTENTR